jgi:hypothetical protein
VGISLADILSARKNLAARLQNPVASSRFTERRDTDMSIDVQSLSAADLKKFADEARKTEHPEAQKAIDKAKKDALTMANDGKILKDVATKNPEV